MPQDLEPSNQDGLPNPARHWGGFVASGMIALSIDATVLQLGVGLIHLHPLGARLIAISCAMVGGWLSHRTLTFAVRSRPTLAEFARYAAVAWTTAAINYGSFATILIARPATHPLIALLFSSLAATVFAYLGMRFGAFRTRK
jgi:putative flippase GtrA